MTITVSVSLWCLNDTILKGEMTTKGAIVALAGLDVEGVELLEWNLPKHPHLNIYELKELRESIESLGLNVVCIDFYTDFIMGYHYATLKDEIRKVKEAIAIGDVLGSEIIRVHGGRKPIPGMTMEEGYSLILKAYRAILPIAEDYGIIVGTEIHPGLQPYQSPEMGLKFIEEIQSDYLKLVLDFAWWTTPSKFVSQLTDHPGVPKSMNLFKECIPYTAHVHAKCYNFDDKGEEPQIPFKKLISLLKNGSYFGSISVEYEGWITRPEADSLQETGKAVDLIRKCLKEN